MKQVLSIAILGLIMVTGLKAQDTTSAEPCEKMYKWFVPSHAKLQYAGNVGFISAGPAWEICSLFLRE